MRWDDLNMGDKSRMIKLAVDSGITDLRTIRDVYNSYANGGQKERKPISNKLLKDLAYKIGSNRVIQAQGAASIPDIARALLGKNPPMDDNKYAYIYGTGDRYPEIEGEPKGFDYSSYLDRYGYRGVKNVQGTINPTKEYHIDESLKPLAEELARNNYHFYDDADDMFLDYDPDVLGYRDDVANFIHQFALDKNGNVVVHDSDVYDFNPTDYEYSKGVSKPLMKLEAQLMDRIGTPYIIRQENQPLYFDGSRRGSSGIEDHLMSMSDEDIAKATGATLLDTVFVAAKHPNPDYDPYDFADGGHLFWPGGNIVNKIRERLYNNVEPQSYNDAFHRVFNGVVLNKNMRNTNVGSNPRDALWAKYLNIPEDKNKLKYNDLTESPYTPTVGREGTDYYRLKLSDKTKNTIIEQASDLNFGEAKNARIIDSLGTHTISKGLDPRKGEYVSYYDKWKIAPFFGGKHDDQSFGIGTPVNIYDRIYLDDYYNVKPQIETDSFYGGYIQPAIINKEGGRIYIRKKNRGKFTAPYKDGGNLLAMGGNSRRRKTLITALPEVTVTPQWLNYWEATPEQTRTLTNKNGKYNTTSMGDKGYTHFDTISARYKGLNAAMQRANFSDEEMSRLSPFLLTQLALEGGWVVDRPDNNFGGMMSGGKRIEFDTEDSFYDAYLKNLDAKWGDEYLGKGKGWRNAKTINEYADIINREDLSLHTKEAFDEYNRKHRDHPAYIYTPLWENNNTGLMDENKFGGIYNRALGNYELLMKRMEEWDKFARNNKIIAK